MKSIFKNLFLIFIFFLIMAGLFSLTQPSEKKEEIGLNTLVAQIENQEVASIIIEGNKLNITLTNDQKETIQKEGTESLIEILI